MARSKHTVIEYRNYNLSPHFPILILSGEEWCISDIPSSRLHFHNCLEIGLCESESGTMKFINSSLTFKKDDVTIIASDVPHTTYSNPGSLSRWSYLFIDVLAIWGDYFPFDMVPDKEALMDLIHNFYMILPKENYPEIYMLVKMIMEDMKSQHENFQSIIRGLVFSLIFKLLNIYKQMKLSFVSLPLKSENFFAIAPSLSYIRNNYMHDFSIEDLASICHLSITHFRRLFTSIMRISPIEYINQTRIANALILLRTTMLPVLTISEEVGFHSVSSFNRQFLSIQGITPLKYRRQMSPVQNHSIYQYTGWMIPPKRI